MLNIDFPTAIFAIVNFILLAAALTKFLYKPVLGMLDKRKQAIDQALDQAETIQLQAREADARLRAQIAEAHIQADGIVGQAKEQAEQAARVILEQAQTQAEQQLAQAERIIEAERRRALSELRTQIADLALDAAEHVLAAGLTPEQKQGLLADCALGAARAAATETAAPAETGAKL